MRITNVPSSRSTMESRGTVITLDADSGRATLTS